MLPISTCRFLNKEFKTFHMLENQSEMHISKDQKVAILFGASGLVGGHCLDFLLADQAYSKIISIGRKKLEIVSPRLEQHEVVFDKMDEWSHLISGDDLFICLGTTMKKAGNKEVFYQVDYEYPKKICKIASAHGVNQLLLVSAVGADPDSIFFYNRVKGELVQVVKKMAFWAIHIFKPSVLIGDRPENRFGEKIAGRIGKGLDYVTGGLLTKFKPVEADVVAKAMVNAAQRLQSGYFTYPSHLLQKIAEEEDALRKLH